MDNQGISGGCLCRLAACQFDQVVTPVVEVLGLNEAGAPLLANLDADAADTDFDPDPHPTSHAFDYLADTAAGFEACVLIPKDHMRDVSAVIAAR